VPAPQIRASNGSLVSGTLISFAAYLIAAAPVIPLEGPAPPSEEVVAAVRGDDPEQSSRLYIGLRLTYLEVEELHEGDVNTGVVVGFRFSPHFGLEASYDSQLGGPFSGIILGRDYTIDALQATLMWYPSSQRSRLRPYLMGGAGFYTSQYESWSWTSSEGWVSARVPDQRDAGLHSGAGFELRRRPGSPSALVTDARWLYTRKDETDPGRVAPDGLLVSVGFKVQLPKWALGGA
jgi:hypothetical protein